MAGIPERQLFKHRSWVWSCLLPYPRERDGQATSRSHGTGRMEATRASWVPAGHSAGEKRLMQHGWPPDAPLPEAGEASALLARKRARLCTSNFRFFLRVSQNRSHRSMRAKSMRACVQVMLLRSLARNLGSFSWEGSRLCSDAAMKRPATVPFMTYRQLLKGTNTFLGVCLVRCSRLS